MKTLFFLVIFLTAFIFFGYNIWRLIKYLKIGKKENRFDKPFERIKNVLTIAIGQTKLFREPVAGLMHALIFWGFLVLLIVVLESIVQGFLPQFDFSFLRSFYGLITATQDIFGILVSISVLFAFYRRFVVKVDRLKSEHDGHLDASLVLIMILIIILSMFGQNIFTHHESLYDYRFISHAVAGILGVIPSENYLFFEICWWIHILTIFTFLNYLPYSKHLHVLTSILNVYFVKLADSKNTLKPINLEDENLTHYGALDIEHLTWKQLFDGYTCTECGRCTSACPAATTGKKLSPRKIIMDIRQRLMEKGIALNSTNNEFMNKTLVHNYINDEELDRKSVV